MIQQVTFKLLKEPWTPDAVISPHGLSVDCQWYLYDSIQPFSPDDDKDIVCPLPPILKSRASREGTPNLDPTDDKPASPPKIC